MVDNFLTTKYMNCTERIFKNKNFVNVYFVFLMNFVVKKCKRTDGTPSLCGKIKVKIKMFLKKINIWVGIKKWTRRTACGDLVSNSRLPVPTIDTAAFEWNLHEEGWASVLIHWRWANYSVPPGNIQVWMSTDSSPFTLYDTIPSSAACSYVIPKAANNEKMLAFKIRLKSGNTTGEFSSIATVDITL